MKVADVNEVSDPVLLTKMGLALSKLILVMRKDQVYTSRMYVHVRTKDAACHR